MDTGRDATGQNPLEGLATAIVCGLLCIGCTNSPFYNEARDKQGQALKSASSEVNLVAMVEALETQYAGLSALEISTLKTRLATTRNFEIAHIAVKPSESERSASLKSRYVDSVINNRFKALLGAVPTDEQLGTLLKTGATIEQISNQAASQINVFNAVSGLHIHDCTGANRISVIDAAGTVEIALDVLATIPAPKRSSARALLDNLNKMCSEQDDPINDLASESSFISTLKSDQGNDKRLISEYKILLKKHTDQYAKLQNEIASVANKLEPIADNAEYRAKLGEAAGKLEAGITRLKKAAQQKEEFAYSHAEAIARLDALETLLGALATGASDPAKLSNEQRSAVMTVRLIPTLMDEADKLLKEARRPRLGPFLLAKEQQRLAVDGFQSSVALLDRKAAARDRQMDAVIAEVTALARAKLALRGSGKSGKGAIDLNKSLAEIVSGASHDQKYSLFRSFAFCFDEANAHRVDQEVLGLNINTMTYDLEIQRSKTAALMWESLLNNIASIISDFHAVGIKSAELAEFLKGFGLVTIGTRVAQ